MKPSDIYILVGCEESQAITIELRKLGFQAFSCDLKPCSGGHPEWHLQCDVFVALMLRSWHFCIFHPECTYVAQSSTQWLSHPDDRHLPFMQRRENPFYPGRRKLMWESIDFVKELYASCELVALENPVGLLSSLWMKPTQIVQPYFFGDQVEKKTCLWLKGVPKLIPTDMVGKGERKVYSSGKSQATWYDDAKTNGKTDEERRMIRSKTFPGLAKAAAQQWGGFVLSYYNVKDLL